MGGTEVGCGIQLGGIADRKEQLKGCTGAQTRLSVQELFGCLSSLMLRYLLCL